MKSKSKKLTPQQELKKLKDTIKIQNDVIESLSNKLSEATDLLKAAETNEKSKDSEIRHWKDKARTLERKYIHALGFIQAGDKEYKEYSHSEPDQIISTLGSGPSWLTMTITKV